MATCHPEAKMAPIPVCNAAISAAALKHTPCLSVIYHGRLITEQTIWPNLPLTHKKALIKHLQILFFFSPLGGVVWLEYSIWWILDLVYRSYNCVLDADGTSRVIWLAMLCHMARDAAFRCTSRIKKKKKKLLACLFSPWGRKNGDYGNVPRANPHLIT